MRPSCDLCGGPMDLVYEVPESPRQASVFLCPGCGLLQTEYGAPPPAVRVQSLSSGPGWGNIRHGKGLRLQANLEFILGATDASAWRSVLDVGSNRGSFAGHVLAGYPGVARFVAVEPDTTIVSGYRDAPGLTFVGERFERVELDGVFDLVYCSHTLEHADSARAMLQKLASLLAPGGCLFVEVPSARVLERSDAVEEFFIDKHRFHFHPSTLARFAESLGLEIVERQDPDDQIHVTLLLRRSAASPGCQFPPADGRLAEVAAEVGRGVDSYVASLAANRARLDHARASIDFLLARQRPVAFWGAGRQLDALLRHTSFDLRQVAAVVDEHLAGIVADVDGVAVQTPDVLRRVSPQVIVAFARNAYPEIARRARSYGVRNVIRFSDLLAG